jgi:N-acetylglucosamine-6-sulfatase
MTSPPNIVLIVADDMRHDLLPMMPTVRDLAKTDDAVRFTNGFNSNPVCIPSRTSILTGNYSQTTGIYGNGPPVGGFHMFDDTNTIAVGLKRAGYTTAEIGKYINDYNPEDAPYIPPGWDRWWAITAEGDEYYDYQVSDQGVPRPYGDSPHEYLTDVMARESEAFIADAPEPFFAYITPVAPHQKAIPSPRHRNLNLRLPKYDPPNLNEEDVSDKPAWVRGIRQLSEDELAVQMQLRDNMALTCLGLDDLVRDVLTTLRSRGVLRSTMVVFCSDNGFMWGEHRLTGKSVPYQDAVKMPMVIRWPHVGEVAPTRKGFVQNIDLAPTFAELAGIDFPCDGKSFLAHLEDGVVSPRDIIVEHHAQGTHPAWVMLQRAQWAYTWYASGEEELYRLDDDPYQLENLAGTPSGARKAMREKVAKHLENGMPPGMTEAP